MSLRNKFLGAACAVAVLSFAAPAFADFNGVFGGDYANTDINQGGPSIDTWGLNGTGEFGLSPDWAAQIDGGYHNASGSGAHVDIWNVDGSVFWRMPAGRIGAVVGYNDLTGSSSDVNATNYGAFGEWFANRWLTAGLKGGGFSASHSTDGEYVGAALTGYVMPDLSIRGTYDYTHFKGAGNENDWGVQAEWLVSEQVPVSIYGGYENSKFSSGGPTANTWLIGLRWYCDPVAGATLVDRQRGGAATWGTGFSPLGLQF